MLPIESILNRIRWDKAFGSGHFEIGYLDHVGSRIIRAPFSMVRFEQGNHFSFQVEDEMGEVLTIPFHRIREIYKDGRLIWSRPV